MKNDDDEPTWPGLHYADTNPNIPDWTPPPAPKRRRFGRFRGNLVTIGSLMVIGAILAGIAFTSTFTSVVRHGVNKIMSHQGSVKSPTLRDVSPSPSRSSSFPVGVVSIAPYFSHSARHTVPPAVRPTVASSHPASSPSPAPASSSPVPPSPSPAPTTVSPVPTPTSPAPAPTPSTTPTVTVSPSAS